MRLDQLTKHYGDIVAVNNFSLSIAPRTFVTLLGPSGCGKTTTLRLIAGLEEATSGRVLIRGEDVTYQPAHIRPTCTVFQSYALFPHYTVLENILFGLKNRGVKAEVRDRRAAEIIALVRLDGMEHRRPDQLSGGQQQRVALARALVNEPVVLLLDEPLGALDAKLRKAMRVELRRLQSELGLTCLLVTHDQEEAISISDYIVVLNQGEIQQAGTPREIFERPRTAFVADFIGAGNLLPARCVASNTDAMIVEWGEELRALVPVREDVTIGSRVVLWVRANDVVLEANSSTYLDNVWEGRVEGALYLGDLVDILVTVPGGPQLRCALPANRYFEQNLGVNSVVRIGWRSANTSLLTT